MISSEKALALVIVGAGGFGREVYWLVSEINRQRLRWHVVGFLDDNPRALDGIDFPAAVLGPIEAYATMPETFAVCAIGNPQVRRTVVARMDKLGAQWATLIHPSSFLGTGSSIGEGSVLLPSAGVTVNASVGRHVHLNFNSIAGHDAKIGDFCTIAPLVGISGNVVLEEGVFVGSHAVVLPKAHVGAWAQVGAGSVVLRHVPPETTVFGVPAKPVCFS
jgi:sugar O-acyltransferase (sialic acid O-acetyltransferase NeuD family)